MNFTASVGGKCPCGWRVPTMASGIIMPPGGRVPPEIYEGGAQMLLMMKCPECGRVMSQTARLAHGHLMSPTEAVETFEAFSRVANAPRGQG